MATRREKCQGINHGICASDPLCSGNAMYFHGSIFNLWRDLDMGRELGQRPTRKHPHDWAWCCAPLEICVSATTVTSPAMKPAHQFRTNNASVDKFIFWPEITYFVHPTILVGRFSSIIQPFQKGKLSFVVLWWYNLAYSVGGLIFWSFPSNLEQWYQRIQVDLSLSLAPIVLQGRLAVPPVAWAGGNGEWCCLLSEQRWRGRGFKLCGWAWIFPSFSFLKWVCLKIG